MLADFPLRLAFFALSTVCFSGMRYLLVTFSYGSEYRLRGVKLERREAFDCVTLMLSNGIVRHDQSIVRLY